MTHDRSQYRIIEISISEMTKTPLPLSSLNPQTDTYGQAELTP
jgi:hypothetical protein